MCHELERVGFSMLKQTATKKKRVIEKKKNEDTEADVGAVEEKGHSQRSIRSRSLILCEPVKKIL